MTKGTFNTIKIILNVWLVLMMMGSVLLMFDDDFALYFVQLIIVILNFWFINQFSIKGEPESKIDVTIK